MAEPYIQEFTLPNGSLMTSVVIDTSEFQELIDTSEFQELVDEIINNIPTIGSKMIDSIRDAGYIPRIQKGSKTAFIFDRYGLKTEICAIVTRGIHKEIAVGLFQPKTTE